MDFTELVGLEITHNKFGVAKIINVEVDFYNISEAKVVVEFQDSQIKKFFIKTLDNFCPEVPKPLLDAIKIVRELVPKTDKSTPVVNKKQLKLSWYEFDEEGNDVTVQNWEQSKKYVVTYQYFNANEKFNIPIVKDNSKVFINVGAACRFIEEPISKSQYIYFVCNGTGTKSTYMGHKWRYATIKDIDYVIDQLKE